MKTIFRKGGRQEIQWIQRMKHLFLQNNITHEVQTKGFFYRFAVDSPDFF